ncbi:MAG: SDR family oxidoreductase [Hyphomicrobiaceae bacterium]
MQRLSSRCAIVTGSVGGLGLAMARALAAEGARVMLHGIEPPGDAAKAVAALRDGGGTAAYTQADLRDPAAIEALVNATEDQLGPVDIVVNNAVVRHFSPIESFPAARWDDALAVNLSAPFHLVRLTLPGMRARNWGRIVNLSSAYGFFADANRIDYVTTKTALLGMTRAVAVETARSGITCNAICPGTVMTPAIHSRITAMMDREGLSEEQAVEKYMLARQPSGRPVRAEDVGQLLVFLCSDAARDMNGAALPMDGAWIAS